MKERKPRLLDRDSMWQFALKALGGRAHSTGELREKLRRRAAKPEDIDDVLTRLKELGYLDDKRFAEAFATSRLTGEKFGRMRVVQDLRRRRVAPPVAEQTVQKVYA